MATRSNIAIKNKDGTYDYVYCHFDGYLDNNGVILYDHYQDENKIRRLIDLGDMSALGKLVEPINGSPHDFKNPDRDVTVFYGRDRGETGTQKRTVSSKKEIVREEYCYLWEDEEWLVYSSGDHFISLEEALREQGIID